MDPTLKAVLLSWDWRADVLLVLLLAGGLYWRGWRRLRGLRKGSGRLAGSHAANWRPVAYLGGLGFLGLALLSPIDVLSSLFFSMHMLQHLLLTMIAPPLLLLADPLPNLMWGLPGRVRKPTGRLLDRNSRLRWLLRLLKPGLVWMIFVTVFLGWHDQRAYEAALQNELVHDLEHISFFATGILFWWHVIGAGPRVHKRLPSGARIAYLLVTVPVTMLTGIAFTFAQQPFYSYYLAVPRPWGVTALEDQVIGGVIIWVLGSMMLMLGALILTSQLFQREETAPGKVNASWTRDKAVMASG
jgi:putative membrane protein